jgi:hypothetical protein
MFSSSVIGRIVLLPALHGTPSPQSILNICTPPPWHCFCLSDPPLHIPVVPRVSILFTRFLKGCCSYFNKSNSKSRRHRPWYAPTQHSMSPPASPLHDTEILPTKRIHLRSLHLHTYSSQLMTANILRWQLYLFGLVYASQRRRWW